MFLWLAQPTTNLRKYPECAFILHDNECVLREIKQVLSNASIFKHKIRNTNYPPGVNRASVLSVFKKNVVFAKAKLLIHVPKLAQNSPGFWNVFKTITCKLQGFVSWKLAGSFFPTHIATQSFKARPVTSIRLFVLEFIQRHCHTRMLRINFGLTWPWPLDFVQREHGMADFDSRHIASTPPVWIRILLLPMRFFTQNKPFEWLQASWRQPNLWLNPGYHGAPSVIKRLCLPEEFFKQVKAWLSRIRAGTQVNMNINIATPPTQWRNVRCAWDAS